MNQLMGDRYVCDECDTEITAHFVSQSVMQRLLEASRTQLQ